MIGAEGRGPTTTQQDRLVITADDFGLAPEVNAAVEVAHREGVLTAASLMTAGPAAADAVERARRLPGLRVGLHVAVVDAAPTLPADQIPRLVGAEGRLRTDLARLGAELAASAAARRQMRAEIEAQFAAFAATGLALDHVNAHAHYHLNPIVGAMVVDAGRRFGARAIRVPRESGRQLARLEPRGRTPNGAVVRACGAWLAARARRHGLTIADQVFGLRWSGAMHARRLQGLLEELPAGLVEIYLHPATTDAFAGAAVGYRYADELGALLDPGCRRAVQAGNHAPGGYADADLEPRRAPPRGPSATDA